MRVSMMPMGQSVNLSPVLLFAILCDCVLSCENLAHGLWLEVSVPGRISLLILQLVTLS